MRLSSWVTSAAAALLAVSAAAPGSAARPAVQGEVVARAAGMELGVEEAASLLAENPDIADDPWVVADMADLWVDYTLLAAAGPGLSGLDLDRLSEPWREEALVAALVAREARPDTVFTDDEVLAAWAREALKEVRVRHLLLRVPSGATPAQRDSVHRAAESLRARAAGGEDFATLARRYSADESAAKGGDLGFIGVGDTEGAFQEAAFALEPGGISQVVETRQGLHVIRLEEKRPQPGLPPEGFRDFMAQDAAATAAGRFVDSLTAAAGMRVEPNAAGVFREMARRGRAGPGETVLVSYRGGEFTASEAAVVVEATAAPIREMSTGSDEEAEGLLRRLAAKEILVREARGRGVALAPAELEALRSGLRGMLEQTLAQAGLQGQPDLPAGAARDAAVRTRVRSLLRGVVLGDDFLQPLGMLGSALRAGSDARVFPATFPRVVERMVALRAGRPRPPPTSGPGSPWEKVPR